MANKKSARTKISRDCFLRIIREKGYTVERLGEEPDICRSGKTIQRCLSTGEIQPELLDRIGRFLDVDPEYLSGEYERGFEEIKDSLVSPELTHYLWTKTDRFPYSKHKINNINYEEYLMNTLLINNISKEQFLSLDSKKRRSLQFDIGVALNNVIKQYFNVDSNGSETDMGMATDGLILLAGGEWIKE